MKKLTDMLTEVTSKVPRRVTMTGVETILEKIAPKLSEAEQKKLAGVYLDLKILSESMNVTPYTIFNNEQWKLLEAVLIGKIAEFKLTIHSIAEDNEKVDCWPLIKAIDTIL